MTAHTGSPMHLESARFRYVSAGTAVPHKYDFSDRVPEIRKWLRTDLSVPEIAAEMKTDYQALARFIHRRRIANLAERWLFLGRKRGVAKGPIDEPSWSAKGA